MNTAQIIHLLVQAQHLIVGRHFHGWYVFQCFEQVKVAGSHPTMHRLVCGVIHVWPHGFVVKWR
jgi:hypothetical protein